MNCGNLEPFSDLGLLAHLAAQVAEGATDFGPSFPLRLAVQGTRLVLRDAVRGKENSQSHAAHFCLPMYNMQ